MAKFRFTADGFVFATSKVEAEQLVSHVLNSAGSGIGSSLITVANKEAPLPDENDKDDEED